MAATASAQAWVLLMPFTIAHFHDLVRLMEEHPDWRTELRRVLFSQDLLDLPHTVQELAVAQRHTEEAITRLTMRMERGFTQAANERRELREDLTRLEDRADLSFAEADEDRQLLHDSMAQGFADAAADRCDMRRDIGQRWQTLAPQTTSTNIPRRPPLPGVPSRRPAATARSPRPHTGSHAAADISRSHCSNTPDKI